MKTQLLEEKEMASLASSLPKWNASTGKITRLFRFDNFIDAFAFMTKVAIISESMGHHPELSNIYSQVKIELWTHDLGGISNLDVDLASKINKII
tara:strand:- start:9532 stop:9816 length:285 start_codon:yes stop_codon:yes gene_type:complete